MHLVQFQNPLWDPFSNQCLGLLRVGGLDGREGGREGGKEGRDG
jgi:hypothetical protein